MPVVSSLDTTPRVLPEVFFTHAILTSIHAYAQRSIRTRRQKILDVTRNTDFWSVPLANEPTRRHSVTAPAQPVQLCRGHGVVTRATRSRRCAQARRHQSSQAVQLRAFHVSLPKAIKNCASPGTASFKSSSISASCLFVWFLFASLRCLELCCFSTSISVGSSSAAAAGPTSS